MNKTKNPKLTGISKVLRKNMTNQEKHLWYDCLKNMSQTFHRQKVIGKYVVDFYCASAKLVIELDGSQHSTDKGLKNDKERDEYLKSLGLTVLRYGNYDINTNFDGICEYIQEFVENAIEKE